MWYSVLKIEFEANLSVDGSEQLLKAGTVFRVKKTKNGNVHCSGVYSKNKCEFEVDQQTAKKIFTSPSNDLGSVTEESFMICEAVYC